MSTEAFRRGDLQGWSPGISIPFGSVPRYGAESSAEIYFVDSDYLISIVILLECLDDQRWVSLQYSKNGSYMTHTYAVCQWRWEIQKCWPGLEESTD